MTVFVPPFGFTDWTKIVHVVVSQLKLNQQKVRNHYFSAGIWFLLQNNKNSSCFWVVKKHELGRLALLTLKWFFLKSKKVVVQNPLFFCWFLVASTLDCLNPFILLLAFYFFSLSFLFTFSSLTFFFWSFYFCIFCLFFLVYFFVFHIFLSFIVVFLYFLLFSFSSCISLLFVGTMLA